MTKILILKWQHSHSILTPHLISEERRRKKRNRRRKGKVTIKCGGGEDKWVGEKWPFEFFSVVKWLVKHWVLGENIFTNVINLVWDFEARGYIFKTFSSPGYQRLRAGVFVGSVCTLRMYVCLFVSNGIYRNIGFESNLLLRFILMRCLPDLFWSFMG